MESLLLKYFNERMQGQSENKEPGPVITISREYGCWGSRIAELVCEHINSIYLKDTTKKWKPVDRHILSKVSQQMNRDPHSVAHVFGAKDKGLLADIVDSFSSSSYTSDDNIKRTISNVVKSFSEQGNTIIVGRAGCVLAKHIPKSIHIKLTSPFEKRVARIEKRFSISNKEARKQVEEIDKKRKHFMAFFDGNKPDDELFDIVLNREFLKEPEIVSLIIDLAKMRKLI